MSLDQLKQFYDFAKIDYSLNSGSLQTLKHILLLKIKSSPEAVLQINGIEYKEEEILQIIEANNSQKPQTFSLEEFWKAFPELKVVSVQNGINMYFKGDRDAFLAYQHLSEAKDALTKEYSSALENEIYKRIQSNELFPAAQRMTFLFAFTKDTQLRIYANVKYEIQKVLQTNGGSFQFLTWEPYYKMLQIAAQDDLNFLVEQYKIGQTHLSEFSYDQWSTFFSRQLTLPFDDSFKSKIKQDEKNYFNANKATDSNGSNGKFSWGIIYFAVVLPIKIIFIAVRCNSGPDYSQNRQPPGDGVQQMERYMETRERQREQQRQRQYYYNNQTAPDTTQQ